MRPTLLTIMVLIAGCHEVRRGPPPSARKPKPALDESGRWGIGIRLKPMVMALKKPKMKIRIEVNEWDRAYIPPSSYSIIVVCNMMAEKAKETEKLLWFVYEDILVPVAPGDTGNIVFQKWLKKKGVGFKEPMQN